MIPYEPRYLYKPQHLIDVPTAWKGIESILHDLISRFCPMGTVAIDIGVDYGYSTVALANFFPVVVGVDTFEGDVYAGQRDAGMYERVRESLWAYPNIRLVHSDHRTFFGTLPDRVGYPQFDLIHVDIVHTYADTHACGREALKWSRVVLFHDTRSFPEVMKAVSDLAAETHCGFYEWPACNGLGILVR